MTFVGHIFGWVDGSWEVQSSTILSLLSRLTKAAIWVASAHTRSATVCKSAESDWIKLNQNLWADSFEDVGCCHQGLHCCARWPYVWRRPLKMNSLWAIFFRSRWIHRGQFFRFGKWDDWKRCTLATSVTNVTNTNTNTNTNANTKHNTNANMVMEQMHTGHLCAVELSCALA